MLGIVAGPISKNLAKILLGEKKIGVKTTNGKKTKAKETKMSVSQLTAESICCPPHTPH